MSTTTHRRRLAVLAAVTLALAAPRGPWAQEETARTPRPQTPITHLIVIFQENVSFDHYFGTYPIAMPNADGSSLFGPAKDDTPSVNGLRAAGLLQANPNAANPFRLDRSQAVTCDQNHDYGPEQQAFNRGLMDKFVETLGVGSDGTCLDYGFGSSLTMGYYDGNTVTALWHYAQYFAMNDNAFGTTFGPSTPGALNLIAGQTNGVDQAHTRGTLSSDDIVVATDGSWTVIGDPDPFYDDCGSPPQLAMTGQNIGDLLNMQGITWGWFQGGFQPTTPSEQDSPAICNAMSPQVAADGKLQKDYSAHHAPFQYYLSTANPHHLPPTSTAMIGQTDQANHQYDLSDFWDAVDQGNIPAVAFLKAKRAQDGHANNSDPLDEQVFLVETINRLQQSPAWPHMAILIAYDDSDGWYDHVLGPIVKQSHSAQDALTDTGHCGTAVTPADQGRCGYGPRLPLLVISPWAKVNFVDHTITDQTSILRFIEDNWHLGRLGNGSFDDKAGTLVQMFDFDAGPHPEKLFLEPQTGTPMPPP